MDTNRIAKEYLKRLHMQQVTAKSVQELRGLLEKAIEAEGEPDEKGHVWLAAGDVLLQKQKRQGDPFLDREAAEQWAKELDIWDEVKRTVEELDEDALVAYVYQNRDDEGLEEQFQQLFVTPDPTYAFIKPQEVKDIEY